MTGPLEQGEVVDWTATADPLDPDSGHAVIGWGYDDTGVTIVTWGQTVKASWAFIAAYAIGVYAVVLPSWATGQQPYGIDMAHLEADLQAVHSDGPLPDPTPAPSPAPPSPPPAPPVPTPSPKPPASVIVAVIRLLEMAVKELRKLL